MSANAGIMNTEYGNLSIDPEVIAKYAGSAAVGVCGVVGMASISVKDGIAKLLKRENLTQGVGVSISENNLVTIDLHIIVSYGVNISSVAKNLITDVKYQVEEFSGLKVEKINVLVEGVRADD